MSATKSVVIVSAVLLAGMHVTVVAQGDSGNLTAKMEAVNVTLEAQGRDYRLACIELYTTGWGQPENRILKSGSHWVAYDPLRYAVADQLIYLVVKSNHQLTGKSLGETASGLSSDETEGAIDSAMMTWNGRKSLEKVGIWKTSPHPLIADYTIFDEYEPWAAYDNDPDPGFPFWADIVHGGWYPREFFECFGPGGGDGILGVSVTFVWVDTATGEPVDTNGDEYLDTALVEIYYNDYFGEVGGVREGNPWDINIELPAIDVGTVALHESGHALGLGHFGPPPTALMNPYYAGICQQPLAVDDAGMSALWRSWPNHPSDYAE